jgi:XTP/dITP diphosphohydrolase
MATLSELLQDKTLLLGTTNKKKIAELVQLLSARGFALKTPSDFTEVLEVQETGCTFAENAKLKARAQAMHRGLWAIGEDSGLCVPALDGAPGVYSARFSGENATDEKNNELLLKRLHGFPKEQRRAYYVSTIALSDPQGNVHIETFGDCWGTILDGRRGEGGFGYDPLFEVAEYHQTFAEMGQAVKRAISHRARSLRAFLSKLDLLLA